MIMKANKQIGFIYKNNESIDKILKDGDVVFERGFLREKTSTTLPITFGGVGKDLKDYKIYGNTVQNGTPTPETPIEMVSCGDKTKNLFDKDNATYKNGYLKDDNGNEQTSNASGYLTSYVEVEPNKTYTIQGLLKDVTQPTHLYRLYFYDINKNWISRTQGIGQNPPYTFVTPNNCYFMQFQYRLNNFDKNTIQIEEGSIATSYEPYGYKIPINVRSENLLNTLNIPETTVGTITYKSENGLITLDGVSINRNIELKTGLNEPLNGQYTVIFKKISGNIINNSKVVNHRFSLGNVENPNAGSPDGRLISDIFNSTTDVVVATGTINDVLDKISIYINSNCTFDNYTFQLYLVKGTYTTSNLPEYQPYYNETTNIYLDEPFRKIGNYSDYIDFINGKVVRNIKEVILNGSNSEQWTFPQTLTNTYRFLSQNGLPNGKDESIIKITTNKFINGTSTGDNGDYEHIRSASRGYPDYIGLNIFKTRLTEGTLEAFKTWLSNNPVTVNYLLATPTEESITLPNIPTVDGNNTLNIETEITPSQVYIKYKSNT